jgi:hypothetical protein
MDASSNNDLLVMFRNWMNSCWVRYPILSQYRSKSTGPQHAAVPRTDKADGYRGVQQFDGTLLRDPPPCSKFRDPQNANVDGVVVWGSYFSEGFFRLRPHLSYNLS